MKNLKQISIHLIILSVFVLPLLIHAQGQINPPPSSNQVSINIPNPAPAAGSDLISLLYRLLDKVVMPIAAIAVVVWIIWAGFSYVTAQGNPAKIAEAHKRLMWSLIGAGILLGAAGISQVVKTTVDTLVAP
jgi:type IV secretory pathway VirB2 component (pilin)